MIGGEDGAATGGVITETGSESWGDGLPADGLAFLVEAYEAAVGVEVCEAEGDGAATAAGGFGAQAQE